jgi:hypothetical protein
MSAKEMIPVGADEYAATLITASSKALPRAAPAARGIVEWPAPQMPAIKYAAKMARVK